MAEAYKGLTIRLGADDTELKSALRLVIRYANQAQTELRRLDKSLKFDTSNVALLNSKMETLGDKAVMTAQRLSLMAKALKEAAAKSKAFDVTKASMESVYSDAEKALAAYNRVNNALATYKKQILELNGINTKTLTGKEVDAYVRNLEEAGMLTEVQIQKLKELKAEHHTAFDTNEIAKERLALKELQSEYDRTKVDIKAMAYEMRSVKDVLISTGATEGLKKVNAELKNSKEITEALEEEYKRLKSIISIAPDGAAHLQAIITNTSERVKQLESTLTSLKSKESQLINDLKKIEGYKGFDSMSVSLRDVEINLQSATKEMDKFREASIEADGKVEALKQELEEIRLGSYTANLERDFKRVTAELKEAESNASKLKADLSYAEKEYTAAKTISEIKKTKSEIGSLEAKVNGLNTSLKTTESVSSSMFWSLRSVGTALMSTLSPAIMMAASSIINSAEEIDSAYRNMRKTVQGTEEQFEYLKSAALDFASTHYTSADQILEIEALGGQLGIAVDNLEAFATVVSNLNIATNITDAEELATQIGKLSGVLEISSDDFDSWSESFGDALVRLGNNEPVLESDVMEIATRFASMSKIIGMSSDELLAWSTTASATGVKAEAAGSSLIRFASSVESACANGGSSLEGFAKVAGMASEEFANLFSNDPSKAMQKVIVGLKGINDAGGSVNSTLQELGINNVRDKQLLEGMVNTTTILSESLTMSADAFNGVSDQWGKSGDAANEAQKKCEGFSGTIQKLRNIAQELGSEVGESVAPMINFLANALKVVTDIFKNIPGPIKSVITALGLLATAAGPTLAVFGATGQAIKNFSGTIKKSNTYINAALSVMQKYGQCVGVTAEQVMLNTDTCKAYTSALDKMTKGTKQQIAQQIASNAAMTAAKAAAVSLAAVGIALCISKVVQYVKEQKKFTKATEGLVDSINKVIDTSGELGSVELDFSGLDDDIDKVIDDLSDLTDSIEETLTSASSSVSAVEKYGNSILELNGKADPTSIAKLQIAVQGFNDACGSNFEVDKETGAILENGKAVVDLDNKIQNLMETKKLQIKLEAYSEIYKESYEKQASALQALTTAQANYNNALSAYNSADSSSKQYFFNSLVQAEKQVNKAKSAYDALNKEISSSEDLMALFTAATNEGADSIYGLIAGNDELRVALQGAGYELDQLYKLSKDDWKLIEDNFDGSVDSVLDILDGFASKMKTSGAKASSNYSEGLTSNETVVKNVVRNIATNMVETLKGNSDTSGAGKNFVEGLANGIYDNAYLVKIAVQKLASNMLKKLENGLNEHSPSKETYKYGMYFDKGLELGISENTSGAILASENLALESINVMKETLNNADYSGYFDLTDDINKAVGQMNSASPSFVKSAKLLGKTINSEISTGVGVAVSAGQESVVKAVNSVHDDLGNIIATYSPDSVNATRNYLSDLARRAK